MAEGSHFRTRVLVVDDHPFFREGLVSFLRRQPTLQCCAEADSLAAARQALEQDQPQLLLLDLQLGDGDGLELLRTTEARLLPLTIVLSQRDELLYAERALKLGARGYVMKDEPAAILLQAIDAVLKGGVWVSAAVNRQLLDRFSASSRSRGGLAQLSNRELQVYRLLGEGRSSKVIASELDISIKTVDYYRETLKQKLGLPDGVALIQHATLWVQEYRGGSAAPYPTEAGKR